MNNWPTVNGTAESDKSHPAVIVRPHGHRHEPWLENGEENWMTDWLWTTPQCNMSMPFKSQKKQTQLLRTCCKWHNSARHWCKLCSAIQTQVKTHDLWREACSKGKFASVHAATHSLKSTIRSVVFSSTSDLWKQAWPTSYQPHIISTCM